MTLTAQVDATLAVSGQTQAITLDVHTDHGAVCSVLWGDNELLGELHEDTVHAIQQEMDDNA